MLPYFSEHYGNAASKAHSFGWRAEAAVALAREQVAASIGARTSEVVFCSGATEANNLALRGAAEAYAERGQHIVVVATEHPSVLDCARDLERRGWRLTVVPVKGDGLVDVDTVEAALCEDTVLVSIMLVNNEIGVIQDIAALSERVHARNASVLFHCDAVQALGKIPIDVGTLGVDLLTVSAHKIYGPKGAGALWRRRRPRLLLQPQCVGGGHEGGLRAGSLPVPLLVGFGFASELVTAEIESERLRLRSLRDRLLEGLRREVDGIEVNGSEEARIDSNLNLAIDGVAADALVSEVSGVAMSTGSACSSATASASHVLAAIVSPERARNSIRLSLGRFTTAAEIEEAIARIAAGIRSLRGP